MKRIFMVFLVLAGGWHLYADEPFLLRNANLVSWEGVKIKTSDGALVVFWEDTLGGSKRIMAMKYDPLGQALWSTSSCVVSGIMEPKACSAVETSDGGYALQFCEQQGSEFMEIRAQKLSPSGAPLWSDDGIMVCPLAGYYTMAPLVADNAGGVYQYWNNFAGSIFILGQHIDAGGNRLWPNSGLIVMQHTPGLQLLDALSDGAGGSIINARRCLDGNATECHLLRLSPTGTAVGNDPLISPSSFPGANFRLMEGDAGEFILYDTLFSQELKLLRIDNTGTVLAALVSHVLPANWLANADVILLNVPSGGLYYIYRTENPDQVKACRLDTGFNQMWSAPVTVTDAGNPVVWGSSFDTDVAGNLWSVWITSNDPLPLHEVRAQLINASGQVMWAPGGMWLANTSRQLDHASVSTSGDHGTFIWSIVLGNVQSLSRQTVALDGTTQFGNGGMPIVNCMAGFATAEAALSYLDGYCALWTDTRDSDSGRLYYQLLDQSMDPVLQPNGVALCAELGVSDKLVSAISLPDGRVAILFTHYATEQAAGDLMLQIIETGAKQGFPPPGLTIAPNVGNTEASMSCANGDLYIAWQEYDNPGGNQVVRIVGQRVHQGQLAWGVDGLLINQMEQCDVLGLAMNADYVMVEYQGLGSDDSTVRVFRVCPDGFPAPGWTTAGLELVSNPSSWISLADFKGGIADNDLICVFRRSSANHNGLFAQRITPAGNLAWGPDGVQLDANLYSRVSCADFGSEVTFGVIRMGSAALWLQRFTPAGGPVLGPEGVMIDIPGAESDDVLIRYPNQWYSFFRVGTHVNGDQYIQHQFISSAGNQQYAQPQVICDAQYSRGGLCATRRDTSTFLIWTDNRKGLYDYETTISCIYGVRVASTHTDNPTPDGFLPALPELTNISPNPFNPSTTISFHLPQAGRVDLAIYNIRGQKLATLYNAHPLPHGDHKVVWDGRDVCGGLVASGIYLCVLNTPGGRAQRRMVLSK